MSWSRKKRTLYCSSRSLISAKTSASRAASARLTLRSSAPMVAVSGRTSTERGPTRKDGGCCRSSVWCTMLLMYLSCFGGWGEDSDAGGLEAEHGGADAAAGLEVAVGLHGVV